MRASRNGDEDRERREKGRGLDGRGRQHGGFEFSRSDEAADSGEFFDARFGRRPGFRSAHTAHTAEHFAGGDHHAKVQIYLRDSYHGGGRSVTLPVPRRDAHGRMSINS